MLRKTILALAATAAIGAAALTPQPPAWGRGGTGTAAVDIITGTATTATVVRPPRLQRVWQPRLRPRQRGLRAALVTRCGKRWSFELSAYESPPRGGLLFAGLLHSITGRRIGGAERDHSTRRPSGAAYCGHNSRGTLPLDRSLRRRIFGCPIQGYGWLAQSV